MRAIAAVPAHDVVALPPGADPVLVAALGLSAVAAWMALTFRGGLTAGERVLVLGAGGVVGQAAVQLARSAGAGRIVAAARGERSRKRALRAGRGRRGAPRRHRRRRRAGRPDWASTARSTWSSTRCSASPPPRPLRALRPHGRLVNLGSSAGETAPLDSSTLRSRSLRVLGYTNNELTPDQRAGALAHVVDEVLAGRLTVAHEPVPLVDVDRRVGPRRATGSSSSP